MLVHAYTFVDYPWNDTEEESYKQRTPLLAENPRRLEPTGLALQKLDGLE